MQLHTAATLPIFDHCLARRIAQNGFTLYDHDHTGNTRFLFDDDQDLLAYVQWTTWRDYAEITAIESARPGCGRVLVGWLKQRFPRLVATSRPSAAPFWRKMGFVSDRDDACAWFWVRH